MSEINTAMKIQWYRPEISKEELKELIKRSDFKGFLQAFGHLFLFLFSGALTYLTWIYELWALLPITLFFHGTVSSFFVGTANHELSHGTVFKTKWLNKAFLNLFSTIGWWNHYDYAISHTFHHRFTLHPEGDREVNLPMEPNTKFLLLLQLFTINIYSRPRLTFSTGGLINTVLDTLRAALGRSPGKDTPRDEWLCAIHDARPKQVNKSRAWSLWLLLFHSAVVTISLLSGQWIFILIFTTSSFTAYWAAYFVGLTQHCGLRDNVDDFRKSTRSIRLGPILGFLYWNMQWHLEHHLFAAVPCYNLKRLSFAISDELPQRKTLIGAWREMKQIWNRQQIEPGYQYDVPLPDPVRMKSD